MSQSKKFPELRAWICAAQHAKRTCMNKAELDWLIHYQRLRLARLEGTAAPKMLRTPSEELEEYRKEHPAKEMKRKEDNADQLKPMPSDEGVHDLPCPPAKPRQFPHVLSAPRSRASAQEGRHLWVIRCADVPVALERCSWGDTLESKVIKHSNLTAGRLAHSGGEIWFVKEDQIAINAASGRYGAVTAEEFDKIVQALRRSGYHVASMGFDIDNEGQEEANRVFAGEPVWEPPI